MKKQQAKMPIIVGGLSLLIMIITIIVVVVVLNANRTTGDLKVEGSASYIGLKCTDSTSNHVLFSEVESTEHSNTIMANFAGDKLSSITYQYKGSYSSEEEAKSAQDFAIPNYNIILERDYGEKNNIFSHSIMRDGNKVSLTITGTGNKVSSRTAPYFMLSPSSVFPKSVNSMKSAYEASGFTCEVFD